MATALSVCVRRASAATVWNIAKTPVPATASTKVAAPKTLVGTPSVNVCLPSTAKDVSQSLKQPTLQVIIYRIYLFNIIMCC